MDEKKNWVPHYFGAKLIFCSKMSPRQMLDSYLLLKRTMENFPLKRAGKRNFWSTVPAVPLKLGLLLVDAHATPPGIGGKNIFLSWNFY